MEPPPGITYTAISGLYVLRSDGALGALASDSAPCTGAFVPESGLGYTAISARGSMYRWAALRSDGAYVYCDGQSPEDPAKVIRPPSGTRFVGIDMGQSEVLAATSDGRVFSSNGVQQAAAPAGQSIISLTAMDEGQGAAAVDDGTILSWGMSSRQAAPPAVPADRATFSTVGGDTGGVHWAIMVGDAIPVDVVVDTDVPTDRVLRVTDRVTFRVTATRADGMPADGKVALDVRAPDGRTNETRFASAFDGVGEALFQLPDHEQVGTYGIEVTFFGSPYVSTTVSSTLEFAEPSPVVITPSGPTSWPATSEEDDTLCFQLATADGSPRWWPHDEILITVEGHPESGYLSGNIDRICLDALQLRPGSYTVHIRYDGWGAADSATLTADISVLPARVTLIESDLPSSWRYGQMPDVVWATVASGGLVPTGDVFLEFEDGMRFGSGARVDATGRSRLWIGSEDELIPGVYPMVVKYQGGNGFAPARQVRTVTVQPGVFTMTTPTITGTTKVSSKLTAIPGTWSPAPTSYRYAWKVDGTAVTSATSSTFTVPPSAAGKKVTVTVTGLKQYYESSRTSAPTAVVAPGTFTAPRPTISGTAKVGKTLTVSRGSWSPTPSSVKYVWKANGVTISTRTTNKFVVPPSAKGKRLTVTVTGSRTGYTTRSVASTATATVAAGTFTAPRPTITGTKRVGYTLTVSKGTWSPAPSSVTYVWKADGVRIATRTSTRFVIPASARGKRLTVTVVGSRTGYTTRSLTSDRTATIR